MSLQLTLLNAISGLNANQTALGVASQNVANANTEGYSRQVVHFQERTTGGVGTGVEVESITRLVDAFLTRELRVRTSELGAAVASDSFFQQIQALFGTLQSDTSVSAELRRFAAALERLALNPEDPALRFDTLAATRALARGMRELAGGVQDLRAEADKEIKAAVDLINERLVAVDKLNATISQAKALGQSAAELEDQRDRAVVLIAEQADIKTIVREDGQISIFTESGRTLLDAQLRRLVYDPAATVTADTVFGAISIFAVDSQSGQTVGSGEVIVTSGTSDSVTSEIGAGRLKGLLDIRDTTLDDLAEQADALASQVIEQLNAVHNDGVGFPAAGTLTGTLSVSAGDAFAGTGTVRIAVVDTNGGIVGSPVDLDLGALGATTVGALAAAIDAALGADGSAAVVDGRLQITAAGANNGIAINEGDSAESGTGRGFSHYFGLNDLLVGTGAKDIDVRSDIVANPGRISTGELSQTANGGETGITIGDNRVIQRLAALTTSSFGFSAVGGLPGADYTLGQFADAMLGLNAIQAANAAEQTRQNQVTFDNLSFRLHSVTGVNVDEELANLLIYQNAFAASARVLTVANKMLDTLLELVA